MPDMIDHPSHYNFGDIETIEIIKDMGPVVMYGFMVGNAIKYLHRALHKGKAVEDLKKAEWYTTHLIRYLDEGYDRTKWAQALSAFLSMTDRIADTQEKKHATHGS